MPSYKRHQIHLHDYVYMDVPAGMPGEPRGYSADVPDPGPDIHYTDVVENTWKVKPKSEMSFNKVKQDRLIKMTDYSVGRHRVYNHLVKIPHKSWALARNGIVSCPDKWVKGPILLESSWDSCWDGVSFYEEFSNNYPVYDLKNDLEELIFKEKNSKLSDAVSDSFSGFDLLTNLAEAPESLELIIAALKLALRPIQGIKSLVEKHKKARARGKSAKEANAEISSQWMQYRYGIMPIVLSIMDAIELLDKAFDEFHTSRAFSVQSVNLDSRPFIHTSESYFYKRMQGTFRISAVGKARYNDFRTRLSDLITSNLFLTAWELIPMSFVIDWFVNVGDVIFSHTSTMVDFAIERKFCTSEKRVYTTDSYFHYYLNEHFIHDYPGFPAAGYECAPENSLIAPHVYEGSNIKSLDLKLFTNEYETYDRNRASPTDVEFSFNPSLSWMRYLDAYVLSLKPILKALKSFKT